jgi:hypothetical protein
LERPKAVRYVSYLLYMTGEFWEYEILET